MRMVTRAQAGLRPPKYVNTGAMSKPSTGHWNGPKILVRGQSTWDHQYCAGLVRGIQNYHMDGRGWADIAYNFVICPHGYTFEGRGLNTWNGANGTNAGNRSSHAVMVLAGEGNPFPNEEKVAFKETVLHVANTTTAPNQCIGHRDHKATACPGDERYRWIHAGMPISGSTPAPPPRPPTNDGGQPLLKVGSRGDAVRRVQTIIRDKAGGNISVDGIFGPQTETRVKDVQRFFKLSVDGIVGPKTWGVLNLMDAAKPPEFGSWPTTKKPLIKRGAKGEAVRYLQNVIAKKAGGGITADAVFGPQTERRVRDVQSLFKLAADGIVGPKTWGAIDFLAVWK